MEEKRTRRRWRESEKQKIVEEATECGNASATARKHGIATRLIFSWMAYFGAGKTYRMRLSDRQIKQLIQGLKGLPAHPSQRIIAVTVAGDGEVKIA